MLSRSSQNRLLAALGATAIGLVAAGSACAQANSTQTTNSSVTVFRPITLTKNTDLSFGTVVRPSTGSGTVTISNADGARAAVGGVALLNTGPNATASRATYSVAGEGGQTYAITVPANFTMTRTGGSETITLTLSSSSTGGALSGALGAAGAASFGVGGSIPVANTTASGAYTGTFNVVVAYN